MKDETCAALALGKAYYEAGDGTFLKNLPTYSDTTSPEVKIYQEYYGDEKYWDTWVQSALDGVATNFISGNADFGAFAGVLERPGKDPSKACVGREGEYFFLFLTLINQERVLKEIKCIHTCACTCKETGF